MELNNLKRWELNSEEIARYTPIRGLSNITPLQLYIPKLMPYITEGIPRTMRDILQPTCFINDSKCKPAVSSTITTQNYKSVPRYSNQKFSRSYLHQGARIRIEVINKDIDHMYVTPHKDFDESQDL